MHLLQRYSFCNKRSPRVRLFEIQPHTIIVTHHSGMINSVQLHIFKYNLHSKNVSSLILIITTEIFRFGFTQVIIVYNKYDVIAFELVTIEGSMQIKTDNCKIFSQICLGNQSKILHFSLVVYFGQVQTDLNFKVFIKYKSQLVNFVFMVAIFGSILTKF